MSQNLSSAEVVIGALRVNEVCFFKRPPECSLPNLQALKQTSFGIPRPYILYFYNSRIKSEDLASKKNLSLLAASAAVISKAMILLMFIHCL